MKKFGFGKKDKGQKETPAASNPYAQSAPAQDPYAADTKNKYAAAPAASPYTQAKPSYGGSYGLPSGPGAKRDAPPNNPAPSPKPSGYGADSYGSGGGYGQNRYDSPAPSSNASRYGAGGYGGLGGSDVPSGPPPPAYDSNPAPNDRYGARPPATAPSMGGGSQYSARSGASGVSGATGGGDGGYGAGGYGEERELTAEEMEEEQVRVDKEEIRRIKGDTVKSSQNALRVAAMAEETGRATLARLGQQGARIHNTEQSLDLAANHNRVAEEKAKELKTLNKSMFAVHVSNPFTANSRRAQRDAEILEKHRMEREERDKTREAAWGTNSRMDQNMRGIDGRGGNPYQKSSLAERSKYQFEADSEDEAMENEIENNLNLIGGAANRLHMLAKATGEEIDEQNKHIDRIIGKSDRVDDQIAMNRARLDRIH